MLSQQQINDLNVYIGTTLQPQLIQMGLMFQGIEQHPDQNIICFQFNLPPVGLLVVNTQSTAVERASLDQIGRVLLQTLKDEQDRVRGINGNLVRPTMPLPTAPPHTAPVMPTPPLPVEDKQQILVDEMVRKFEVLLERAAER